MQAERLISTTDLSHDEWLRYRRQGIGGSDISVIAGVNPWKSPVALYMEKLGELPEPEQNEAMRWGTLLEPLVAEEFKANHPDWRIERVNAILRHPQHPEFLANVDRRVYPKGAEPGILEIKTTGEHGRNDWQDGRAPYHVQVQLQWYLSVTGYSRGWLAVLIGGWRYVEVEVERDDEVIAQLQAMALAFWRCVETRTPPELDGSDASAELLTRLYPEAEAGKQVLMPLETEDLIALYKAAKAEELAATARCQEAENRIKALMGDGEIGLVAGEPRVSWKTVSANRLDTKRLKAEQPTIYQQYAAESVSRRFQVKGA